MESRIGEAEGRAQLQYLDRVLDAAGPEARQSVLVEALLLFGHRFGYTLKYCADVTGHAEPFDQLLQEFGNLLANWIEGQRLTTRADEDERRAAAAVAVAEQDSAFAGLAAKAILALPGDSPQRDADLARRLLKKYEAAQTQTPGGEDAEHLNDAKL